MKDGVKAPAGKHQAGGPGRDLSEEYEEKQKLLLVIGWVDKERRGKNRRHAGHGRELYMVGEETDREKEREQEEARELAESAAKEQAKLEEEERKVREVAEANAAAKRAEEEAEAAKKKALEEERARARAEIGGMAQTVDMAPEKVGSMMKEFEG